MVKIAVAGAGGFIGHNLVNALDRTKYEIIPLKRQDFVTGQVATRIRDCDIVVNLTGESVAGIWTSGKREKIVSSRIDTTRTIVNAINENGNQCRLLVQISAVGIYDHVHVHDESSTDFDNGFLGKVVRLWEEELRPLDGKETRVVILRLGVVLNSEGGMFPLMRLPFKLHLGIGIGSDDNFPFIHLADLIEIIIMTLENESIKGVINVVSPGVITIRDFFKGLAAYEKSKVVVWLSPRILTAIMGESSSMITEGQKVVPRKLNELQYDFLCPGINEAFQLCLLNRS